LLPRWKRHSVGFVVALKEYRSSSLAAGQRRRKSAGASLTSTPKNRVWDFEITPSGRPCADLDLSWETAIGSVQYTYKIASGRAEFLTRDPLGFKAGPNMYTYVRQNPWTHFDPEGLDWNLANRGFGALMAVGGAVEAAFGATLVAGGVATSEIGVGIPIAALGAVLAFHGADTAVAGAKQAATGTPQATLTQQAVTATAQNLGASPTTAHVAGVVVDVGLGLGAGALGSVPTIAARGGLDAVTHLTNPAAAAAINTTGTIKGASGIYALQTSAVPASNLGRNVATMVGGDLSKSVPITGQAAAAFSRPPITGPVSGLRNFMGQASAPAGTINTATMTFVAATAKTTGQAASQAAHAAAGPALDAGYHAGRAINAAQAPQQAPNPPPPPPPKQNN
jgi:hypothetical protein